MNNYHTHTKRCKHASGSAVEYAAEAALQGSSILGISDHTPLPDNRWPWVRMAMEELPLYEEEIEDARRAEPELIILKAAECEWDNPYHSFYKEELLDKRGFDYLIGALHWFPHRGSWLSLGEVESPTHLVSYAKHLIKTIESGLFTFIAHPDGFGAGYKSWDKETEACSREIIEAAAATGIPLEINGYGFRKKDQPYPVEGFWEVASGYPVSGICNSDAHSPKDVLASIDRARELGNRHGIELIDTL